MTIEKLKEAEKLKFFISERERNIATIEGALKYSAAIDQAVLEITINATPNKISHIIFIDRSELMPIVKQLLDKNKSA